jgi:hypothetical protein
VAAGRWTTAAAACFIGSSSLLKGRAANHPRRRQEHTISVRSSPARGGVPLTSGRWSNRRESAA